MTARTTPPFRADHVGSFLRPQYLLEARAQKAKGAITAEQLRTVEDQAIREIVKFQEDVGLKSITDGEFRRTYFHIDFLEQLGGVKTDIPVTIKKPDGTVEPWEIEAGTPNTLFRLGFTRDSLKPGTVINVDGYLARDGSHRANGRDMTLPDGRKLFMGGAPTDK